MNAVALVNMCGFVCVILFVCAMFVCFHTEAHINLTTSMSLTSRFLKRFSYSYVISYVLEQERDLLEPQLMHMSRHTCLFNLIWNYMREVERIVKQRETMSPGFSLYFFLLFMLILWCMCVTLWWITRQYYVVFIFFCRSGAFLWKTNLFSRMASVVWRRYVPSSIQLVGTVQPSVSL